MPAKNCTHINVTGIRCGSPALHGERFCYYHQRVHRGVPEPRKSRLHPIAQIDTPEAIQASLMEVLNAIVRNDIDPKRAGLLIRGLHIASKNVFHVRFNSPVRHMVREVPDQPESEATPEERPDDPFAPDPIAETYQIPFSDSVIVQQTKMHEEVIQRHQQEIIAHQHACLKRERERAEAIAAAAAASTPPIPHPAPPNPVPEPLKLNPAPDPTQRKPPVAVTAAKAAPVSNKIRTRSG